MRRPCFRRVFLVLSFFWARGQWKQFVQWPVLKFYGDISYGLYLIHLFVITQCKPAAWEPLAAAPAGVGHFE